MEARNSPGLSSSSGASTSSSLKSADARENLFEKILDQLAGSSLFSSGLSPTIFIVYAHNNDKQGTAYDECVRELITWLERIHARILSDQSPLPLLGPRIEGTDANNNILSNQICLLPPSRDGAETPTTSSVDKVIVCGSEVLERYCSNPSARPFIDDIVQVCKEETETPTTALMAAIRERVETECGRGDFHHILTELAFLEARKASLLEAHGMVPVTISQTNADDAPMRYLPMFWNTDVKLKLKSPTTGSLHKLFFKLLKRLFPDDKDFIKPFRKCYNWADEVLGLDEDVVVSQQTFDEVVNRHITEAYEEYWKLFCVVVRDGKLQAYAGKLSKQVSQVMEHMAVSQQHEILKWVSPVSASELHGKYHDAGTSRLPGTCDWVVQHGEFSRWYAYGGGALLFLCGEMGTGKTYSTSRVIDWVKQGLSTSDNDEAFAYFYCNKQDPLRSEPKEILRNIVRQLATGPWKVAANNCTAVHELVHDLWNQAQGRGIGSTLSEWEECLLAMVQTYPRTTIVLDAFDECDELRRRDLLNLLVRLVARDSKSKPVKIFLSSRPHEDVRRYLETYPVIRMQQKHNAKDIAAFVHTKIAEHRRWSKMPQDFRKKVVDKLLEKSGDMFLFASLQIQRLQDCNTRPSLWNRLTTLPDSLNKTYEDICNHATPDADEREVLNRVLRWVLCSTRPLTTDELLFAVSQDSESGRIQSQNPDLDEALLLGWTHNLLSLGVNNGNGPPVWRLAHQAVAEFLQQSSSCNLSIAHWEAGTVCLMILSYVPTTLGMDPVEILNELYDYEYSAKLPHYYFLERCSAEMKMTGPMVEYATNSWPTHVRAQEDVTAPNIDGLSRILRSFLGKPEKGTLAYDIWIREVRGGSFRIPTSRSLECSVFEDRYMPGYEMTPIMLACHLGIYTPLLDWWCSCNFALNRCFDLGHWYPNLTWRWFELNRYDILAPPNIHWSLLALACLHGETNIIECLLKGGVRINTENENEVPPIVAASVSDCAEAVEKLIELGSDMCTPYGLEGSHPRRRSGHALWFAIARDSLKVMNLLLREPALACEQMDEVLGSLDVRDFHSSDAMTLLLDAGVNVNAPLSDATLLGVAAVNGWEDLVRRLLKNQADVNAQPALSSSRGVLAAALDGGQKASLSIAFLLLEYGAPVTSSAVVSAWFYRHHDQAMLDLLLSYKPNLDEIWIDEDGHKISALIEAVKDRDLDRIQFLAEQGADMNLKVGEEYGDALSCVFWEILKFRFDLDLPDFRPVIDVLRKAGASFETPDGNRVHTALAAAAFAGSSDLVQELLNRGASPYAPRRSGYYDHDALGAAAVSYQTQAPQIMRMLLNSQHDVHANDAFFRSAQYALQETFRLLVEPYAGRYILLSKTTRAQRMDVWLESAIILISHGAICDVDVTQWRSCLKFWDPKFCHQNSERLDELQQMLATNRTSFFVKFPEAESEALWSIKDAEGPPPSGNIDTESRVWRRMYAALSNIARTKD